MSSGERFTRTLLGGGAKSTEGYRVYFNSKSSIEYVDRNLKIFVPAEVLSELRTMAIYPEEMRIGSFDGELVSDANLRGAVLERVRRAGAFLGWTLVE